MKKKGETEQTSTGLGNQDDKMSITRDKMCCGTAPFLRYSYQ